MDGRYIPEHIPWEFEEEVFAPMPWIPEGSLVSKSRFHEVRQEQRPKSYSPPPTPPPVCDFLPLDTLPFPAIIPPSTEGPTLKRAASFHPGGSQRLRREALVIDGKVTIDTGFKLEPRSRESIVSSSSEPNNVDLLVRQLDSGQQSGLERLKNSMLRLMKAQSQWQYSPLVKGRKRSESPQFSAGSSDETKDKVAEGIHHEPLAMRRGLPAPSTLKLVSTRPPPVIFPCQPHIPSSRGSPTTSSHEVTWLSSDPSAAKRESICVEDMCTNLRYLVSPIIPDPANKEEISSSQNCYPTVGPMGAPGNTVGETPLAPLEDWNFASELECVYGDDPFSYFGVEERMPSFIRPLSLTPDVVEENTETRQSSGSLATSVSTFPEPPTDTTTATPNPYITVSGDGAAAESSQARTRLSSSPSATASDEDILDSGDEGETLASLTVSSTDASPRSSEDKDEPLAFRRLTLLARYSATLPEVEGFSSPGSLPSGTLSRDASPVQETPKPTAKIVRFASETEEHTYLGNLDVIGPPSGYQRPRSSSVPVPQKGSLRNQTFFQQDERTRERLSRSQPVTLPSRIPKKRTFTRTGTSGRHLVADQRSPETFEYDGREKSILACSGNETEGVRQLPSLIPVPGLKVPHAAFSLDREKVDGERRVASRNSRLCVSLKQPVRAPVSQSAQPQQKTSLTTSWSMTLRQYVKGGDSGGERRQALRSPSTKRHGELNFTPSSSTGTKGAGKSLLPVKKASFFRDGVSKVATVSGIHRSEGEGQSGSGNGNVEGKAIGLVDKTGGISYIAPSKARAESRSQGRAKGERQGASTVGTRTLRPVQIRNLLGRFAT